MKADIQKHKDFLYGVYYSVNIRQKTGLTIRKFKTFQKAQAWFNKETRKIQLKTKSIP